MTSPEIRMRRTASSTRSNRCSVPLSWSRGPFPVRRRRWAAAIHTAIRSWSCVAWRRLSLAVSQMCKWGGSASTSLRQTISHSIHRSSTVGRIAACACSNRIADDISRTDRESNKTNMPSDFERTTSVVLPSLLSSRRHQYIVFFFLLNFWSTGDLRRDEWDLLISCRHTFSSPFSTLLTLLD